MLLVCPDKGPVSFASYTKLFSGGDHSGRSACGHWASASSVHVSPVRCILVYSTLHFRSYQPGLHGKGFDFTLIGVSQVRTSDLAHRRAHATRPRLSVLLGHCPTIWLRSCFHTYRSSFRFDPLAAVLGSPPEAQRLLSSPPPSGPLPPPPIPVGHPVPNWGDILYKPSLAKAGRGTTTAMNERLG